MARQPRRKSGTGVYHVMLRGIDKRDVFLKDEDKKVFLYYLFRAKELGGFKLYAYCLMNNHVHLLIKEGEDLGKSIKRITVGYVQWHNKNYERTGHLFQNRYRSEAVEDYSYLVAVTRYIHQNPVKAGMIREIMDYKWSSYRDYIASFNNELTKIDTELIKSYFTTLESFNDYMNKPNDDKFLEYEIKSYNTNERLKNIINSKVDLEDIRQLQKAERDEIICQIYESTGASIRQLSEVMGIGRGIIHNAVKNAGSNIPFL